MVLSILIFFLLGGFQIPCCLVDLKIQENDPMAGDRAKKGVVMRVKTNVFIIGSIIELKKLLVHDSLVELVMS